jgi:hypothetical protein
MSQKDIERLVRQITWPAPSASLRARVLSAAVVEGDTVSWSDRVWYSRAWRLAAAGAALAILLIDQFSMSPRSAGPVPANRAIADANVIDETGRQMGLPPEVATSLARRALSETPAPRMSPSQASTTLQTFDVEGFGGGR